MRSELRKETVGNNGFLFSSRSLYIFKEGFMKTKFDIGEFVFIPVKVVAAYIDESGTHYKVKYNDKYGQCVNDMNEDQIAGDLVLGTIDDGSVFNPSELWNPASIKKPKEENNATT